MSGHEQSIPRFPLEWPLGWKRTPYHQRQRRASFSKTERTVRDGVVSARNIAVGIADATTRLERQIEAIGGTAPTLSTNVRLRMNGQPDARNDVVVDPGAAVYFRFKGKAVVFACDRYERVADNIAALSAHIDALRRIERYGVGSLEQALSGYKALPADTAADWRSVFGLTEGASAEDVDREYKRLARQRHPDHGGSDEAMAHLNRARDYAYAELVS